MKYIRVAVAERHLNEAMTRAGNIHRTGSVRGMVKLYGWTAANAWRIGNYIYHFTPKDADMIRAKNLEA